MKNADWNNLRARLHHDWMQKHMTFLIAWAERLDDSIESRKPVREDIPGQFIEFQNRTNDFETLIDETVSALSPAQLLNEYPLIRMTEENRKWLADVVHALYCERTGIKKTVVKLKEKFRFILEMHLLLSVILDGKNGQLIAKAGKQPFREYYSNIQEFSRMISSLPHEVQVV